MELFEFFKAIIFAIPLGIFATLTALLCVISVMKVREIEVNHKRAFFFFLSCATVSSALLLVYYYFPEFFKKVEWVYCGTVMFHNAFFHHFVCLAIRLEKRFNPLHYIVPAIAVIALFAVGLFSPEYMPTQKYTLLFCFILSSYAFYIISCLYEMHRFYVRLAIADRSTDAINHSRVIIVILKVFSCCILFGLIPFIGGQNPGMIASILQMANILAALVLNISIVYSIIRHFTLYDINRSLFDAIQWRRPPDIRLPEIKKRFGCRFRK